MNTDSSIEEMDLNNLTAISPIDGRYAAKTEALRPVFSEYGLIHKRLLVEIRWLQALSRRPDIAELPELSRAADRILEEIVANFSPADAERVKEIEKTTNHDVKAVEYFIREKIKDNEELCSLSGFIHFACTSEDINNLSHGLMLTQARERHLCPDLDKLIAALCHLAERFALQPMLSRTHGQPATPTTLGKELAVFAHRLRRQLARFREVAILGKMNGAVGNFNAHLIAYPGVDWVEFSESFVESLGLIPNPHTTQIESHDYMAEYFHALSRINTVLVDFCRDVWGYVAIGYFQQKALAGEVGSSTMPHKVNPIDFENAEGNLGLANALLIFLAEKLPVSRWQRDLTDSTSIRNMGTAIAHCIIAYQACLQGMNKLEANTEWINRDLENNFEVLAEAIQTVMRRHGIQGSYEKLKELTRGQQVTRDSLREFISALDIPAQAKDALLNLSPADYTGNAVEQTRQIISQK